MSLKLANNQVTIYLKNAQTYLKEAHDLCPVKSFPEWETIEKAVIKAEEHVTKIINKFEESLYQPRGSGPSPLLKPCQLKPAAGGI